MRNVSKELTSLTKPLADCDLHVHTNPKQALARITGFAQDAEGHWFAQLSCGHTQHVRHDPPWQNRAWVLNAASRQGCIGQSFTCGWCAKAE